MKSLADSEGVAPGAFTPIQLGESTLFIYGHLRFSKYDNILEEARPLYALQIKYIHIDVLVRSTIRCRSRSYLTMGVNGIKKTDRRGHLLHNLIIKSFYLTQLSDGGIRRNGEEPF